MAEQFNSAQKPVLNAKSVLNTIACSPKPVSLHTLHQFFDIQKDLDAQKILQDLLQKHMGPGRISQREDGRYQARETLRLPQEMVVRIGDVIKDGHIEVTPLRWGASIAKNPPSLFITKKEARHYGIIPGQGKALIRLESRSDRKSNFGQTRIRCGVIQALENSQHAIVQGTIHKIDGVARFVPDKGGKLKSTFNVSSSAVEKLEDGHRVLVQVNENGSQAKPRTVRVRKLAWDNAQKDTALGRHILAKHDKRLHHSSQMVAEAQKHVEKLRYDDYEDLTSLPFVAMDGKEAKDHDDVVYTQKNEDGTYTGYVAIADLTQIVPVGSKWDLQAMNDMFSVYAFGHTSHLYPEIFAREYASLIQGQVRPAVVMRASWGADGRIIGEPDFIRARVRTAYNLTYDRVDQALLSPLDPGFTPFEDEDLQNNLMIMREAEQCRKSFLQSRGELEFFDHKIAPNFDENGSLTSWNSEAQSPARNMIKTYMNTNNEMTGAFLQDSGVDFIARVQYPSDSRMLSRMVKKLEPFKLRLPQEHEYEEWTNFELQSILDQARKKPSHVARVIESIVLSALKPAEYVLNGVGHTGMGQEDRPIIQSSSPIRRYIDLVAQRAILKKKGLYHGPLWSGQDQEDGHDLAYRATSRHKEAKRAQDDALVSYAVHSIGKFSGRSALAHVEAVSEGGVSLLIGDCPVPISVPFSGDSRVNWSLTKDQMRVIHPLHGAIAVGDEIRVKIGKTDALTGGLDITFVGQEEKAISAKATPRKYEAPRYKGRKKEKKGRGILTEVFIVAANMQDGLILDIPKRKDNDEPIRIQMPISELQSRGHSPKAMNSGREGLVLYPSKSGNTIGGEFEVGKKADLIVRFTKTGGSIYDGEKGIELPRKDGRYDASDKKKPSAQVPRVSLKDLSQIGAHIKLESLSSDDAQPS